MRTATLMLVLALAACSRDPHPGSQFGEEDVDGGCIVGSTDPLTPSEVSPLGFTAQEVMDLVLGTRTSTLTWANATTTDLTVAVSDATNLRVVHYVPDPDAQSNDEMALDCEDALAIDVVMTLDTADGALADTSPRTLQTRSASEVSLRIPVDDVQGTLDLESWAQSDFDDIYGEVQGTFTAAGLSGGIWGFGESTDGTGPDASVSQSPFQVASFGQAD